MSGMNLGNFADAVFKHDGPKKDVYYSHDEINLSQFLNRQIRIPFCNWMAGGVSHWECMRLLGYTLPKENDPCISMLQLS